MRLKEFPDHLNLPTGRVLWRVFTHHPRESRICVPGVKGLTSVPGEYGLVDLDPFSLVCLLCRRSFPPLEMNGDLPAVIRRSVSSLRRRDAIVDVRLDVHMVVLVEGDHSVR